MKENKLFALVEKGTKRVISIVDDTMIEWYRKNFTLVDIVEINSVGSGTSTGDKYISYVLVTNKEDYFDKYYLIVKYSENFKDVNEAYEYINNNWNK